MNTRLLPPLIATMAALSGCSLLIDLPADCSPEDCNGFVCNDAGTECLFVCENNDQCADDYTCNSFSGAGTCVPLGCEPTTPIQPYFDGASSTLRVHTELNGDGSAFAAGFVDDSGKLRVQIYGADGAPIGAIVDLEPPSETPGRPSLTWAGSGWGVAWEATGLAGNPGVERERALLRYAFINPDGTIGTFPVTLWYTIGDERSVDDPSIVWDPKAGLFVAVWSTQFDTGSDLFLMSFRADGSSDDGETPIPHEDGIRITLSETDSFTPTLSLRTQPDQQPNLYDVVFREGNTRIRLGLRTVNANGEKALGEDVDLGLNAGNTQIVDFGYATITTGNAAAFSEKSAAFTKAYRVQLLPTRGLARDDRFELADGLDDVTGSTIGSALTGEYATLFTGIYDDSRGVYLTRFLDNGVPINATFEVTDDTIFDPEHPHLQALPGGYAIFYTTPDDGALGQFWTCEPPPEP